MVISYKDSGVDKEEGYKTVDFIRGMTKKTYDKNVISGVGSFAALYELSGYKNPVLVSATDGVGTKLKLAFETGIYNTVGIDAVAMCINDILCHGAKPIFFLDYLACGKLDAKCAADLVQGVVEGCSQSACALVGGETAEMPGFYKEGDYDIAGFAVGAVEKDKIIDKTKSKEGDVIIALSSSGVHSNGFSLVRKLLEKNGADVNTKYKDSTVYKTLLTPTKIYARAVLDTISKFDIHSMAHITGGGLIENVPRSVNDGLTAVVEKNKIKTPEIFDYIESLGVSRDEMYGTFNMGVGFTLIVDKKDKEAIISHLISLGENAYQIGEIAKGGSGIVIE